VGAASRLRSGRARGGRIARRTGWGVGDQAFSSLTNFALGVLIARSVAPKDFGAFSLMFATYTLCLGLARSVTSEPLVVRFSHSAGEEWRSATASATGAALLLGIVCGTGCILFGVVSSGALAQAFVALGITMPGLLLQDTWRYAFFARGTGGQAFLNDLVWALIMFPVMAALIAAHHTSMSSLTLGWGGAGAAAGLLGILQAGIRPRPTLTSRWLRGQSDLASRFAGEFVALSGARQLSFYAVGAIAGLVAAGAIRGAQILLGPVQVLNNGIRLVAIPEAVRLSKKSVHRMRGMCNLLSAGLSAVALLAGATVAFLPDPLGRELLGPTWSMTREVAIPTALMMAAGGISTGAVIGLRALAAGQRSFAGRILVSVLQVAGTIGGAALGGAVAAAWGLALGVCAGIPVWQWQLRKALAEHEKPVDDTRQPPAPRPESTLIAAAPGAGRDHGAPSLAARQSGSASDLHGRRET
jgi:O-antigen/teichoic acid export membrane protein